MAKHEALNSYVSRYCKKKVLFVKLRHNAYMQNFEHVSLLQKCCAWSSHTFIWLLYFCLLPLVWSIFVVGISTKIKATESNWKQLRMINFQRVSWKAICIYIYIYIYIFKVCLIKNWNIRLWWISIGQCCGLQKNIFMLLYT